MSADQSAEGPITRSQGTKNQEDQQQDDEEFFKTRAHSNQKPKWNDAIEGKTYDWLALKCSDE